MGARLKWPKTLRSVQALTPRVLILGMLGLEYVPLIPLYGIALKACWETSGEPYAAAIAHFEESQRNETAKPRLVEAQDEWDMPAWEPVNHDPFAELDAEFEVGSNLLEESEDAVPKPSPLLDENGYPIEEVDEAAEPEPPSTPLPNPYLPNFWCLLGLIGVFLLNALTWFIQRWSIGTKVLMKYSATSDGRLRLGTYAYVVPHIHQGAAEILPVQAVQVGGRQMLYIFYQRQRYEIKENGEMLEELDCPVNLQLSEYVNSGGLASTDEVKFAKDKFEGNSLNLPQPTFKEMFTKQILGPVPVFQMLCTCLWLMDAYWNYAIFNLCSIGLFEASTAFGRLKNLGILKGMRNKATLIK
eukprot:gene3225-4069_t